MLDQKQYKKQPTDIHEEDDALIPQRKGTIAEPGSKPWPVSLMKHRE